MQGGSRWQAACLGHAVAVGHDGAGGPAAVLLGLEHVALLEQHIPQLVQVVPGLGPQVSRLPSSPCKSMLKAGPLP